MLLVKLTTRLPSLVKFGEILRKITGGGKFTSPPWRTYIPDAPRNRVKKNRSVDHNIGDIKYLQLKNLPISRHSVQQSKTCECQVYKIMSKSDNLTNPKNKISLKLSPGGNCKSTGIVYAVKCRKCNLIYVGHLEMICLINTESTSTTSQKRRDQNELATQIRPNANSPCDARRGWH